MITKEMTITATSAGYYGGDKASISVDGQEIGFGNYGRGFNMAVFDEITGKPLFCTSFDTPIGTSDILAQVINGLPDGRIVVLAVKGDGVSNPLSPEAKLALKNIGSAQIDQLQAYQSYTLVGIKGTSPGAACAESISWSEISSSYTFDVESVKATSGFLVEAISLASKYGADKSISGGKAEIKLNGNVLPIEGGTQPGWNYVILDAKSSEVKSSGSFNPWNTAQVDGFVEKIQGLEGREIVAIATLDYIGLQVEQKLKKALSLIGASMVGNLTYGGSWAIVGYRGAKPGKAVENLDNISAYTDGVGQGIAVKYWVLPTVPENKQLKLGQKLSPNGASYLFSYYEAAHINGEWAIVGDANVGNVYMYHLQSGEWQLQQQLQPEGRVSDDICDYAVGLSGNFAIVGQRYCDAPGKEKCGAARIYELTGGKWVHRQMLQPSDLKAGDNFGFSVAIDGKVAIVGACGVDVPSKENCGAFYIFHLVGGKWVQKAKLQPDDLSANDSFGLSVSIDMNTIVVGSYFADAPGKENCGVAYIFQLIGDKWVLSKKLQPLDLRTEDCFGCKVAVADNWIIVGASQGLADAAAKNKFTNTGSAYIYQLQNGEWQLYQNIFAEDATAGDWFGTFVGIENDVVLVGASNADANGKTDCGAVYLFELVNNKWEQKQKLQPSELPAKGRWGASLSFDGNRAIIGSRYFEGDGFAYIVDVVSENDVTSTRFSAV